MRGYEGVHKQMNAVVFYSNTGESQAIAEYLAGRLEYPLSDVKNASEVVYEDLVLVFPVHCQNVPNAVCEFLGKVSVKNLTAVATYGKMCPGNVLQEIQKKYCRNVVAAALVPAKHTYVDDTKFSDFEKLNALIEKIKSPAPIQLPRLYKNPLANLFPNLRSRLGAKMVKSKSCNGCGVCEKSCPRSAIRSGVTDKHCIRCARCVNACPQGALSLKLALPLRLYLKKKKMDKIIIYI